MYHHVPRVLNLHHRLEVSTDWPEVENHVVQYFDIVRLLHLQTPAESVVDGAVGDLTVGSCRLLEPNGSLLSVDLRAVVDFYTV